MPPEIFKQNLDVAGLSSELPNALKLKLSRLHDSDKVARDNNIKQVTQ